MPNTSATGGYLTPDGAIAPPLEDNDLDDFLGDLVGGVTGLDRDKYVRPRWQEEPPNLPARNVNWVAVGVTRRPAPLGTAAVIHDPDAAAGYGADVVTRHEELEVMCSFYGPGCQGYAAMLRDGLYLGQNREELFLAGMGLVSVSDMTKAPELIKSAWYPRTDITFVIRREVRREYSVLTIQTAEVAIVTDVETLELVIDGGQNLVFSDPLNSGLIPNL